ncbi:hypothetical protein PRZ48_003112 [Zasmidium cellare]|uniref:Transcription factor domain-containing protein n=1 Tax=Zasmidium cellare TaxID=395010 RepID=A0ABR0EU39_ZASCE|nr:hypothetical protein PRZ48_003112 [Zasmidium cellare]
MQETNPSEHWQIDSFASGTPFPSFFEQIMAPQFEASSSLAMPPDIFNTMPELDWFSDTTDHFGLDFTPTIDNAIERQLNDAFPTTERQGPAEHDGASDQHINDSAKQRHAIFQRSLWLWKPDANQNAFSEHNNIPMNERQIDMGASPHQPYLPSFYMEDTLSQDSRDRILQLVVKTAKSHISIPSFPSISCLDTLLKVGIAKRLETDAWIHPYTFESEKARPELLIALIAAGCVCFGIPRVSKTGLVLFEIVRVALNQLTEEDNSVIRDLQYLQACMIWIDVTAFCGFQRKMQIAESSLQPLVTALRRTGKFDHVAYSQNRPSAADEGDELEAKWRRWVEDESYKRQSLQSTKSNQHADIASTALFAELLMMSLHVSLDEITRFAGKCGEAEAHRAYQTLRPWSQTKQARTAVWHAGQVVRLAREVLPYQLRGADSLMVYHAMMVLWAYGMMLRDAARRMSSDRQQQESTMDNELPIFLDETSNDRANAFLLMNSGRPCLRLYDADPKSTSQACDVRNAQAVMAVGISVLEGNLPNEIHENLPQLIRSLCELMKALGSLK